MKLQARNTQEDPEINITSLIDVVFLLLLFFMLTTTFEREASLQVQIPEASQAPAPAPAERLELIITADGRYYIGNNAVVNTRPQTLKAALAQAAGGNTGLPVLLRADANTPHQAVVTAMDALAQLGFSRVSIATTTQSNSDPQ